MLAIKVLLTIYLFMVFYSLLSLMYYDGPSYMPKLGLLVVRATWIIFVVGWVVGILGCILVGIWTELP